MRVILDFDDVLNQCNATAIQEINRRYGTDYCLSDIHEWGPVGTDLDKRIHLFKDPDFMRSIPLQEGAVEFVSELMKECEVFIATGVNLECAGVRVEEIIQNFPIPPENILIGQRKDILYADVILDDGYHNLKNSNVRFPVLWDRPWNERFTGLPRVKSYAEFLAFIRFLKSRPMIKKAENLILVGPSGSGKTSIANACRLPLIKTYTTRPKRTETEDGYHFISREEFQKRKANGFFLETTEYDGEFYGTDIRDFKKPISKLFIMDINGALRAKKQFPENTVLFYVDRDKESCVRSILERSEKAVRRICSIDEERRNKELCDFVIRNDHTIEESVSQIFEYIGGKING